MLRNQMAETLGPVPRQGKGCGGDDKSSLRLESLPNRKPQAPAQPRQVESAVSSISRIEPADLELGKTRLAAFEYRRPETEQRSHLENYPDSERLEYRPTVLDKLVNFVVSLIERLEAMLLGPRRAGRKRTEVKLASEESLVVLSAPLGHKKAKKRTKRSLPEI